MKTNNTELTFYGASDDLIEIEARPNLPRLKLDEVPGSSGKFLVVTGRGERCEVTVSYGRGGVWKITYSGLDEEIPAPPGRIGFEGYTAKLTLLVDDSTTVHRIND